MSDKVITPWIFCSVFAFLLGAGAGEYADSLIGFGIFLALLIGSMILAGELSSRGLSEAKKTIREQNLQIDQLSERILNLEKDTD